MLEVVSNSIVSLCFIPASRVDPQSNLEREGEGGREVGTERESKIRREGEESGKEDGRETKERRREGKENKRRREGRQGKNI